VSRALNTLLAFLAFSVFAIGIYYSAATLASLDRTLVVALISGAALIIAGWVSRIFERRKETEAHFRQRKYDQYSEFLGILYGFMSQSVQTNAANEESGVSDAVVKKLNEWQWRLILFASPGTIRSYVSWMDDLKSGEPKIKTILLMEAFFRSLRSDLGISNLGLKDGDFGHFMLKHGALFAEMAAKKPNMTLRELSDLEKKLGLPSSLGITASNRSANAPPAPSRPDDLAAPAD
jgi:hypothetical protein